MRIMGRGIRVRKMRSRVKGRMWWCTFIYRKVFWAGYDTDRIEGSVKCDRAVS